MLSFLTPKLAETKYSFAELALTIGESQANPGN